MIRFTPTEKRIADVLSDGRPHYQYDLMALIDEVELTSVSILRNHLSSIRRKLPEGETILFTVLNKRKCYQHVRLLPSAYDGRT